MATTTLPSQTTQSIKGVWFKQRLQELRKTDNFTNLYYLFRTYLFFAFVIGGTIWFYYYQASQELSFWWNIPVTIMAIILIGAGQHQLTGLAHEASHHILFKNRIWNDLASDWFCMFPMYSCTQHYRLQHMAHHQFVNDPQRDPDVSQLETSGHWLEFPLSKLKFLMVLVKQLWIPNLIRYMRIRAKYNALPTDKNPYLRKDWKPVKTPVRVGILYLLLQVSLLSSLGWMTATSDSFGWRVVFAVAPLLAYAAAMVFYARIPSAWYHHSRVHPVISMRSMTLMRISYLTALFVSMAWLSVLVDPWTPVYYLLLWIVPIFTSFSFFMILRQLVQHGNGGRGWLTNTRVFLVNPFIRFAVFPLGQDYHLPHHLYASIPHYRLKQLHEALMECTEYRQQAVVVEGYFFPHHHPQIHPTVLDVLGPDYHYKADDLYIDNDVLEGVEVDDKEMILREAEEEKRRYRESLEA
ncbi:MAG: fatty acid desaturase family protein [Gemmataceae bacterium]